MSFTVDGNIQLLCCHITPAKTNKIILISYTFKHILSDIELHVWVYIYMTLKAVNHTSVLMCSYLSCLLLSFSLSLLFHVYLHEIFIFRIFKKYFAAKQQLRLVIYQVLFFKFRQIVMSRWQSIKRRKRAFFQAFKWRKAKFLPSCIRCNLSWFSFFYEIWKMFLRKNFFHIWIIQVNCF